MKGGKGVHYRTCKMCYFATRKMTKTKHYEAVTDMWGSLKDPGPPGGGQVLSLATVGCHLGNLGDGTLLG